MGKYYNLQQYLYNLPNNRTIITMTFTDIEGIINDTLPPSARKHEPWWANDLTHNQAQYWLDIGWKTMNVNIANESVAFYRA